MGMTREDKYGTKRDVEKYCCGSCANYDFEYDDDRNKCRYYNDYYYKNDSCSSHWEEASECSYTSEGCFLTTACCAYKGLPDDCEELETLRHFRDTVLDRTIVGHSLKLHYYEVAPKLLEKLEQSSDKDTILSWLYEEILNVIALIKKGLEKEAVAKYLLLTMEFEEKL